MWFLFSPLYSAKKDLPKECTLLCGTAVGLLLGIICTELKIFVSTRESIIQLLLVAGKMSIFIFLFPFCYFYLTKLFVSHNYIFILCYSSSPKGQSLEAMQPLRLYFLSRFMALHDFLFLPFCRLSAWSRSCLISSVSFAYTLWLLCLSSPISIFLLILDFVCRWFLELTA